MTGFTGTVNRVLRLDAVLLSVVVAASASCNDNSRSSEFNVNSSAESRWSTLGTRAAPAGPQAAITDNADAKWADYDPPATYPRSAVSSTTITMPDGVQLAVSVTLPADAAGNTAALPLPTIVSMTGYNKAFPGNEAVNAYLVSHGYAHVVVDARGTGSSGGQWESFGATEQGDYFPTLDWIAAQPFCDGKLGLYGGSLLGITSTLAAAKQHPAVKAMFVTVPMADGYRDIVFTGGQTNVGFIPLWLGQVTAFSALNPGLAADPANGATRMLEQVLSAVTHFQVPLVLSAVTGDPDTAYDGDFWTVRSPIEQAGKIQAPTFIVGGLQDLFQRGQPLLYESLKNHTTAKLLLGPWTHIGTALNNGLPADGVPVFDHIALQWFDQYLKGLSTGADGLPNVTQFVYGHGHYATSSDWPHPQARAQRFYLRGDQTLSPQMPAGDEPSHVTLQQPINGLCSASAAQWTAGALGLLPLPCVSDDTLAEALDVVYETAPMEQDFYINGPIAAELWVSTTGSDGGVAVRVDDVDGSRVTPLTNGLQSFSLRAVDMAKSRTLDGQVIQPWHPFTQASVQAVSSGVPMLVPVEIFPTSALLAAGHKLRISIGPSDVPHGLPPLPSLLGGAAGVLTVYSDAAHPSSVVLPVVPASALQ